MNAPRLPSDEIARVEVVSNSPVAGNPGGFTTNFVTARESPTSEDAALSGRRPMKVATVAEAPVPNSPPTIHGASAPAIELLRGRSGIVARNAVLHSLLRMV